MPAFHHHLKNYFIPHEGNGYKPDALRPKRLLFHTIGAIAAKTVVFAVISSFPLSAWISADNAVEASKQIIIKTNETRTAIGLPAYAESDKLDQAATQKVEDMFLVQYFAHTSPAGNDVASFLKRVGYDYSMAGENLAMGYSSVEDIMAAWQKSPTHYANLIDPNFKEIGVAVAGGRLKNNDTALAAQYFGRPSQTKAATIASPAKIVQLDQTKTVLSVKGTATITEKILNVKTELPAGTTAANAVVNGMKLALVPSDQNDTWQGNAIITADTEKQLTQPVVPATVEIQDAEGELAYADLSWTDVKPVKASILEQYSIYKASPSAGMRPVLDVSNIYLTILLVLVVFASLLNIFIELKKQHPHIILSSVCATAVLVFLILV